MKVGHFGQWRRMVIRNWQKVRGTKSPAQLLIELSGAWKDDRKPEEIISEIRKARKNKI
jgi:hypothetical protein